jgi:hypothetical protein
MDLPLGRLLRQQSSGSLLRLQLPLFPSLEKLPPFIFSLEIRMSAFPPRFGFAAGIL